MKISQIKPKQTMRYWWMPISSNIRLTSKQQERSLVYLHKHTMTKATSKKRGLSTKQTEAFWQPLVMDWLVYAQCCGFRKILHWENAKAADLWLEWKCCYYWKVIRCWFQKIFWLLAAHWTSKWQWDTMPTQMMHVVKLPSYCILYPNYIFQKVSNWGGIDIKGWKNLQYKLQLT